jgi:CBS domain-containing protein
MHLANVLDTCSVTTVTLAPEQSLAEAARAMHQAGAMAILVKDGDLLQGFLTAEDVLCALVSASEIDRAWNGPVRAALCRQLPVVTSENKITEVVEAMAAAGIHSLPVTAGGTTRVINLCRLLQMQINNLHSEVQHLQTYIDALHDAPND